MTADPFEGSLIISAGKDGVFLMLHHIFNALHAGAHFRNLLSGCNQLLGRRHERLQKALHGQEHTAGQLTSDNEQRAYRQKRRIGQIDQQIGNGAKETVKAGNLRLTGHNLRLCACPLGEHSLFCAAGLDGLHHRENAGSFAVEGTGVSGNSTRDINALSRYDLRNKDVDQKRTQSNQCQQRADGEHDNEIHHHGKHTNANGCQRVDEGLCDGGILLLSVCNIARHSLGEKAHRQAQYVLNIGVVCCYCKLTLYVGAIRGIRRLQQEPRQTQPYKSTNEGHHPDGTRSREDLVNKRL